MTIACHTFMRPKGLVLCDQFHLLNTNARWLPRKLGGVKSQWYLYLFKTPTRQELTQGHFYSRDLGGRRETGTSQNLCAADQRMVITSLHLKARCNVNQGLSMPQKHVSNKVSLKSPSMKLGDLVVADSLDRKI